MTKFTITTCEVQGEVFGEAERMLFSTAVAVVRNLRELHMPHWEAFVWRDASDCCEPLHGLPLLEMIFVSEVKVSDAFPSEHT